MLYRAIKSINISHNLESWAHMRDAARLFNPDCPEELANAMKEMLDDSNVEKYVERGKRRLQEISSERDKCEIQLISMLISFEKRRECWD